MKRTTWIFCGAILAVFSMLCMGIKLSAPSGGSSTLTSGQFNANQFSVAAGVVYDKIAGIETNRSFWGDAGSPNIVLSTAAGGAPRIGFSPNSVNRWTLTADASDDTFYLAQTDAVVPFRVSYGGNSGFNAGLSVGGSFTNTTGESYFSGNNSIFEAGGVTALFPSNLVFNTYGSMTFWSADANSRIKVYYDDAASSLVVTNNSNTQDVTLLVTTITSIRTNVATFTIFTNAPAFAEWRTNARRLTVEADFLLTPAVAQPAGVTLTVEMPGSFTNVWLRTAPANLSALTVGMTHRIQPGARYKFTDSSGAGASAAFVAQAYAEVYE